MEEVNNRRNDWKEGVREWLANREWPECECYPFQNLNGIEKDMKYTMGESGIRYIGCEPFGETLIFGGIWEGEGVSVQINVNPLPTKEGIRVLFRWNSDTNNTKDNE
jgi:hypothetical protein